MNLATAWGMAGGHGLVGIVDTGLTTNHSELRSFTPAGGFTRGNFLPAYSLDVGRWPSGVDSDVDERQAEVVQSPSPACPTDPSGMAPIDFVGHGTHVSGLVGANAYDSTSVEGVCKNCGIGMWRIVYAACFPGFGVLAELNTDAAAASITLLGDVGAQVISQSFGFTPQQTNYCMTAPNDPFCLAMAYVATREVLLVAASGNTRTVLNFPARDERVVAAGGFEQDLQLWDEDRDPPPSNLDDCPIPGLDAECGSNYSPAPFGPKQEVVASARDVYGLMYPGLDWNTQFECGDAFGPGGAADGYGNCTGTSMSAPQIAGVMGLLRSINPLVKAGDPGNPAVLGIRDVLATTTFQAQAGLPWGQRLGYGRPDVAAAARLMLGRTAGAVVRNRATPLFGFYSAVSKDYAFTSSPNTAIAFLINKSGNSVSSGSTVPGYPQFPPDPLLGPNDVPRSDIFIMSTEYKTSTSHPDLVPLYMLDRSRHFPIGCNPSLPTCNINNRDFLLATGQGEVEALHALGYGYRGVQGYVYQRCTPEPACIPDGAEKLWRKCKSADDDCAIFLESARATFESNGYTATLPAGFPQHIGYAYPNIDSDADGLIDGLEMLIGTSHTLADTDGDSLSDGIEFPMAAVSNSDPCVGPLASRCPADLVFANGFQP